MTKSIHVREEMTCVGSCFLSLVIYLPTLCKADHGRTNVPTLFMLGRKERQEREERERKRKKIEIIMQLIGVWCSYLSKMI